MDDEAAHSAQMLYIEKVWANDLSLIQSLDWPIKFQRTAFYYALIRDYAEPIRSYMDYLRSSFCEDMRQEELNSEFYSMPLEVRVFNKINIVDNTNCSIDSSKIL